MEAFALSVLLSLCSVWAADGIKTAQIAATVLSMNTGQAFNTSYYIGIYGRSSSQHTVSGL